MDKASLILHPVRARIALALTRGRHTAGDLRKEMPDVAVTTLYRHLRRLVEGGVLQVVEETQVRGTVERTYELDRDLAQVERHEGAALAPEEHHAVFTAYTAHLTGELERYLDSVRMGNADPFADALRYVQLSCWLDAEETEDFHRRLDELLALVSSRQPAPGRRRITFAVAVVPAPGVEPEDAHS
ncbi:helix-turn-helix domain-containing protein [Sinosporangium siamense]|uniref:Helix-turn-helix domain-containing protein n=1 Tax=Sinosporangium siamense TaxID=1367973 RepID=A0A919REX3_9ACTN|nr:helix-turn-helix domain-containing protein [Sinosporangium siamense]GII90611.1 hypothetical protein Ssi02_08420 [Sinosporangium siamense]